MGRSPALLPCWRVMVRAAREGGRARDIASCELSYTEARALVAKYEATGWPVHMVALEELQELNRRVIAGEFSLWHARRFAQARGYFLPEHESGSGES